MKRSKAYVNNRRDQIVAILEKDGKASVADLAERFGVSPLTIRRDLDFLEERKVLSREYGTAKLLNPMGRPSGSRQIRAITAISRLAARYVDDGDLILINTSATAIAMLDHIEAQDVTCMTNMGKAILLDSVQPNVSLMLTGGEIRPPRTSLTGVGAISSIEKVTAAKCFLGCTGLSAEYGLTSATAPEPAVNAMMLERSKYHVILADSSKLGVTSSFQFGSADEIDLLITDTGATDTQVALLSMAGVKKILRVDPSMPSAAPIVS